MIKNLKNSARGIVFVVILISICLAGCSTNLSQNPSSSSGQQSDNRSAQQQQPGSPGQQPPGAVNMDAVMTAILNRAAEILGISSDKFTAAFQNAQNAMPKGGASGSGQQGQPPTAPSGQQGQPTTPPSGQQMSQSKFMTEIYEKMAVELNISADDIAKAMEQAQKELQK